MSTTSKSPRRLLKTAYALAQGALPAYSHRFSPKKFTQHQLFACLVRKEFLKTDYRGLVEFLADCDSLRAVIELEHVPHFTTVQKAADRLHPWAWLLSTDCWDFSHSERSCSRRFENSTEPDDTGESGVQTWKKW